VRGTTAQRLDARPLASRHGSTCEVGQAPRSIPPSVPLRAAHGNPAGFHTFPPAIGLLSFMGEPPMKASRTSAAMRGSGSEKRRRVHKVDTRWDGIEHASLAAAAQTAGLTKGGYIRALALGCPGPRSQRAPSVNAQALAQATAALNKVGSNMNQIARVLNAGGAHVTTEEYLAALREVRVVLATILEIVGRAPRA